MPLDIRTLLLVLGLLMLVRAAVLVLVYRKQRRYLPAKYWAIGSTLLAAGTLLVGLRTHIPLGLSVLGGQAAVLSGWMLLDAGFVLAAHHRVLPRVGGVVVALALVAVAWFLWGHDDYVARTVAVSVPPLLFDLYATFCALFPRSQAKARKDVFRWVALVLLLTACSNVWKLMFVVSRGGDVLFEGGALGNVQFYLWTTVSCVLITGLCVLLTALRTEGLMDQALRELRDSEEKLRNIAHLDPLTHLPNRRLLDDRLTQAVTLTVRNRTHGALLMLDLDNFKTLNDLHGHAAGDLLLREVARRTVDSLRAVDTAGRIGGDEFVVILSGLDAQESTARKQAQGIAEKIREALARPYVLPPESGHAAAIEHHCSASIGVVVFQGGDNRAIMKAADHAMYLAKEHGRNQVRMG